MLKYIQWFICDRAIAVREIVQKYGNSEGKIFVEILLGEFSQLSSTENHELYRGSSRES